jgi:hypothetical protein
MGGAGATVYFIGHLQTTFSHSSATCRPLNTSPSGPGAAPPSAFNLDTVYRLAGNADVEVQIAAAGAIPSLVQLLGSRSEEVQRQAVLAVTP